MENTMPQYAAEAHRFLLGQVPADLQRPSLGIICGSGLGGLADSVLPQPRWEVHYRDIPHFAISTGTQTRG